MMQKTDSQLHLYMKNCLERQICEADLGLLINHRFVTIKQ